MRWVCNIRYSPLGGVTVLEKDDENVRMTKEDDENGGMTEDDENGGMTEDDEAASSIYNANAG